MLLAAASISAAYAAEPSPAPGLQRRPNILVVYTDDQSWRTLSCYRDDGAWPWVHTPSIDRLAREGVRFRTCYGAAWCTPSRVSFLTGCYPHGVEGVQITTVLQGQYDPRVCRFWPAELRKAGYRTAMIGKWHIGRDAGHGRDWDRSVVWNQADIGTDWYTDQPLAIDGGPKQVVPGYSTTLYTRYAADFVRGGPPAPWFYGSVYNAPHAPMSVHPRHRSLYAQAEVPIPVDIFGPRENKPAWQRAFTQWQRHPDGMPAMRDGPSTRSSGTITAWWRVWTRESARS